MSSISGIGGTSSAWSDMSAMRSLMQAKMFAKADADGSGGVDQTELQGVLDAVAEKTGFTNSSSTAELLTKMDSDGNGTLSSDELAKGMQGMMPPPPDGGGTGGSDDLFSKIDSDGDSLVSKVEMQIFLAKMTPDGEADSASGSTDTTKSDELFAKLDTDGDGSLSQSEFDAGRPEAGAQTAQAPGGTPPAGGAGGGGGGGAVSGVTTYDPLDTNEDGVVSLEERMAGNASTDAVQALFEAIDTDGDSEISSAESNAFIQALSDQVNSTDVSAQGALGSARLVELVQRAYAQVAGESVAPTQGGTIDITT
ncbi:XopAW family type III secretion system calcium-binding effector [Variovorax sp. YR216]|uniref:XopAW family type III secretion system calcium-binding effector n=1 Tax=Variovorax sp. YR216 TaxID=1882828 RepID=UPI00089C2317|nr:XopAW family type III secretion system calcium-binding effector [Variovorax sp. YR216]SEB17626.1 Ca2+-binding protein, EF-hand superfamily [Variovorax sp. YR216]